MVIDDRVEPDPLGAPGASTGRLLIIEPIQDGSGRCHRQRRHSPAQSCSSKPVLRSSSCRGTATDRTWCERTSKCLPGTTGGRRQLPVLRMATRWLEPPTLRSVSFSASGAAKLPSVQMLRLRHQPCGISRRNMRKEAIYFSISCRAQSISDHSHFFLRRSKCPQTITASMPNIYPIFEAAHLNHF